MAWYRKYYEHKACGTTWTDEWSCACNDRCPCCNVEVEPYDWDDLTVLVGFDADSAYTVLVSPISAEHDPAYLTYNFGDEFSAQRAANLCRAILAS